MTDETDAPAGGAEAEAVAPPSDAETASQQTSEDATEQHTGTEEPGQADETGEPPKRKPWWEKRFGELTAEKHEAQRQADYWRGLAEGRSPQQPAAPQVGPPQVDQFESYDDYEEAKIAYVVEQRLNQAKQQEQHQTVLRTYEEKEGAFRASKPDYDTVARDPTLPITPVMAEVIRESDLGPELAYHLGTNRQEAQRIAGLSPQRQAAELGRLEVALTRAPAPSLKPIPPAPPQTVSGLSAGLAKSPEDMPMSEYMQWVKERDKT